MLLLLLVTLYTSRVILENLGIEDYGIYNVVCGIVIALSFLNGAMAQSTQRFFSFEIGKSNNNLRDTFNTALIIHIGIAFIILIVAETLGLWLVNCHLSYPEDKKFAVQVIYQCSVVSFLVSVVQVPFTALIISHERMGIYAYVGIFEAILKLVCASALALFNTNKLITYGILILTANLLTNIIYIIYSLKSFNSCRIDFYYDRTHIKKMTSFAGWNSFGHLVTVLKGQGLNITLNMFFGPAINAAFGIANQVNTAVGNFNQSFLTAVNPQIVKLYAQGKRNQLNDLLFRAGKFSFYLILLMSFPILLYPTQILGLWLKNVPSYTAIFVVLILTNSLIESFSYSIGTAIQATGNISKYQIFVSGINLSVLPIAIVFFHFDFSPIYGLISLCIVSLISFFVRMYFVNHLLHISFEKYFSGVLLKTIFIGVIASFLVLILHRYIIISWFYRLILLFSSEIFLVLIIFLFGIDKSERQSVLHILKKKLKKS